MTADLTPQQVEALRVSVESVYSRHSNGHEPLNHVNVVEWIEAIAPTIVAMLAEAAADTATAWQINGWADVLLPADRNPIANAQRVTDWLRNRAALAATPEPAP